MPDNIELAIILRNTETASRDARAAFDATERLVEGIGGRFDSVESRIATLESRIAGLERRVGSMEKGLDGLARSNYKIETMLADIAARLPTP
jgi:septal ring factor EnvC (AmiA/AmiB activator)